MKNLVALLAIILFGIPPLPSVHATDTYADYRIGKTDATVQMTIFHDFQCPFCARFHQTLSNSYDIQQYVADNLLSITYKDFPLNFHQNAMEAAMAANAVLAINKSQYEKFIDLLYDHQDEWASQTDPFTTFGNYARQLAINQEYFKKLYNDANNAAEIKNDSAEAEKLKVTGTPSYSINGRLFSGSQPIDTVLSQIQAELRDDPLPSPFDEIIEPPAGFEKEVITAETLTVSPFRDGDLTTLAGKAAAELFVRGVIGGFPDGEFKGERPVNRAEAAKFLLLSKNIDVPEKTDGNPFLDVLLGEWYAKFVIKAAEKLIIEGFEDGTFRPALAVQRDQFLAMFSRTFQLPTGLPHAYQDASEYPGAWFWDYAGIAAKYDLFPGETRLNPSQEMTRNEVAIALYQYFKSTAVNSGPKSVVKEYLYSTLGNLEGARYDFERSKQFLAPELQKKATDDSFIPLSYGFQDGPDKVEIYDANIFDSSATIWVRGYFGESVLAWIFELDEEGGVWLITNYYPLTDETVL